MAEYLLDSPTLNSGDESTAHGDARVLRVATLTIVWHPDVARIGESAVLPGGNCDVSRVAPLFGDRASEPRGRPSGTSASARSSRPSASARLKIGSRSSPGILTPT
jgi:hypothetical protein